MFSSALSRLVSIGTTLKATVAEILKLNAKPEEEATAQMARGRIRLAVGAAVIAVFMVAGMVIVKLTIWSTCPTSDIALCLSDFMRGMDWLGYISSIALMIVSGLTFFPDEIMAVANGLAFGPWIGSAVSWIGAMTAANIAYWFGRRIGPKAIAHAVGEEKFYQLKGWAGRHGAVALAGLRLLPFIPSVAIAFTAGAIHTSWYTYNLVTALAIIPTLIVFSFASGHLWRIPLPIWLLLFVGLIALVVIVLYARARGHAAHPRS